MGLLDKFSDAQKGVSEKAKSISEANNLKRKILYEEERIVEIFTDIGKRYTRIPTRIRLLSRFCVTISTQDAEESRR